MLIAHSGLPEFDYIKPQTLVEASIFLAEHPGEALPFMGGTDVFVRMRDGQLQAKYLVDVKHLDGTQDIVYHPQQGLALGAGVNMNRVIASADVATHYPLLAEACRTVASYQLRTRATIVGNLCNASPAGDTTGACLVLGGELRIFNQGEYRQEPLSSFFLGPGKTRLRPEDIVTALVLPPPRKGGAGKYLKLGRNALGDLAIVGVTVLGYPDLSTASGYQFRIALASVAPTPLIPQHAQVILSEKPVNPNSIQEAAQAAMHACSPIDDVRGGSRYRREMVRKLTEKALVSVWQAIKS